MKRKPETKKKASTKAGAVKRLASKAIKLVKPAKAKPASKAAKPKPAAKAAKAKPAKPAAKPKAKAAPKAVSPRTKPAKPTPAKATARTAAPKAAAPKPVVAKPAAKPAPATARAAPSPAPVARRPVAPARPLPPIDQITEDDIRQMPDDQYMNEIQLEFFRRRLLQMRQEVLERELDVKERLNQREVFADPADRATAEEEHWLDLRLRERESLLLKKIDDALRRIKEREYGYCEVTGEAIGIPRLLARPTATVCVDVKGQNEQIESQYRDR